MFKNLFFELFLMGKKLALSLIVAGGVGALVGGWNLKNALDISEEIRNEPKYFQLSEGDRMSEVERDARMRLVEPYAGFSAALTVASAFAFGIGVYYSRKRDYCSK